MNNKKNYIHHGCWVFGVHPSYSPVSSPTPAIERSCCRSVAPRTRGICKRPGDEFPAPMVILRMVAGKHNVSKKVRIQIY